MSLVDRFIALAAIDTRRLALERKLSQASGPAKQSEARARAARDAVATFKETAKRLQLEAKRLEAELKAKQAELEKTQVAQNQAKGNEEYRLLGKKIEGLQGEIGAMEIKILEEYERQDSRGPELAALEKAQKDAEAEHARVSKEMDANVAALQAELARVMTDRKAALGELDAKTIEVYNAALAANGDSAVAAVQGTTCQGCFITVRPQQVSTLRGRDQVVTCFQCSRILYLEGAAS